MPTLEAQPMASTRSDRYAVRVAGAAAPGDTLMLHRRDAGSGEFVSESVAVAPGERPPMREVRRG